LNVLHSKHPIKYKYITIILFLKIKTVLFCKIVKTIANFKKNDNTQTIQFCWKTTFFMKYAVDKQERFAVLRPDEASINADLAPKLRSELYILHNEGVKNLILDLSAVNFVDSSGLSAILTGDRLWKDVGTFVLSGITSMSVKKLIEISRLNSILKIVPTLEEAKDFVFMEEIEREIGSDLDANSVSDNR
jgi:anti-sigma B factor antagonist